MRLRRVRTESGVAAVEFAVASLFLVPLLLTGVDIATLLIKDSGVATAMRGSAIQALNTNSQRSHDQSVLVSLLSELRNRSVDNTQKVVIFDASASTEPPATCLTNAAEAAGGVAGSCNVYGPDEIAQIYSAASATQSRRNRSNSPNTDGHVNGNDENTNAETLDSLFGQTDCSGSIDTQWCPTDRKNDSGWSVGVYVEARYSPPFGILPMLRNRKLTDTVVVNERQTGNDATNVAEGRTASQSCDGWGAPASRAVDGNTDGNFNHNSVSHTCGNFQDWWSVDLGSVKSLRQVDISNRTDCCSSRLSNFVVLVSPTPLNMSLSQARTQPGVKSFDYDFAVEKQLMVNLPTGTTGRYVYVWLKNQEYLHLAEVKVFS